MRIYLLIYLLFGYASYSLSNDNISGIVLDKNTKQVLPYANIAVSGNHMGTVSNSEGKFILSSDNINKDDTVLFSYMGYKTLKVPFTEIDKQSNFYLESANISLTDVNIYSRDLSAEEIIEKVVENYAKNHPSRNQRQRIFAHSYIKTPFSDKNKAKIIRSNFTGLEIDKFDQLFDKIPSEFIDYNDAIFDLYTQNDNAKLVPIKGISLEEGNQKALLKEVETQLSDFIGDFENTLKNPDVYYKFKTGLIGVKLNPTGGDDNESDINDSLSFKIPVGSVKYETISLIRDFATLAGDNTEFLEKKNRYKFELEKLEFFNGELVYQISFKPKSSGLFEGEIFISSSDFGIHQMDYSYGKGKSTENIQILGIGHAINYRKSRVIFEKEEGSYHLKYIYAEEREMAAIDRKFSLMKKQKRFLIDKELNEVKFDIDLLFNVHSKWELLVLEQEPVSISKFENIKQPKYMNFEKELAHSPEDWENRTFIVPNEELKKYTRKKILN